jgi:hypothetical protein
LETQVHPYGSRQLRKWVPVPPVPMRKALLREAHEALGHVGRDKLVEAILAEWWWEGLRGDAAKTVRTCPACAKDAMPKTPPNTTP